MVRVKTITREIKDTIKKKGKIMLFIVRYLLFRTASPLCLVRTSHGRAGNEPIKVPISGIGPGPGVLIRGWLSKTENVGRIERRFATVVAGAHQLINKLIHVFRVL